MTTEKAISHELLWRAALNVADKADRVIAERPFRIFGVPRGGVPAAYLVLAAMHALGHPASIVAAREDANLVIEHMWEREIEHTSDTFTSPLVFKEPDDGWLLFPWEDGWAYCWARNRRLGE